MKIQPRQFCLDLNLEFAWKFLGVHCGNTVGTLRQYDDGVNQFSCLAQHFVRLFCVKIKVVLGLLTYHHHGGNHLLYQTKPSKTKPNQTKLRLPPYSFKKIVLFNLGLGHLWRTCGVYAEPDLSAWHFYISGVLTMVTGVAGIVGNILSIVTLLQR